MEVYVPRSNTFATFLCQRISFPFQVPPVPLDVFHHGVLPRQLVVVWEVVDDLEIVHAVAGVHREKIPNEMATILGNKGVWGCG